MRPSAGSGGLSARQPSCVTGRSRTGRWPCSRRICGCCAATSAARSLTGVVPSRRRPQPTRCGVDPVGDSSSRHPSHFACAIEIPQGCSAARHGDRESRRAWLRAKRGEQHLLGVLVSVLFLIPFVNEAAIGVYWFLLKVGMVVYTLIWFRATFPRLRYDQLMNFGWKYLIPIAMGAILVNDIVGMI